MLKSDAEDKNEMNETVRAVWVFLGFTHIPDFEHLPVIMTTQRTLGRENIPRSEGRCQLNRLMICHKIEKLSVRAAEVSPSRLQELNAQFSRVAKVSSYSVWSSVKAHSTGHSQTLGKVST